VNLQPERALVDQDRVDEAKSTTLEGPNPATLETHFNLIRTYLRSKRIAEALRLATRLSNENADDVHLHFSLGVLLASEKQYKAAEFELQKAEALKPGTFEILFNLGQAALGNGDYPNAVIALSHALKLKPESSETLYLLGQAYTDESRPLDALDVLIPANKMSPRNPDILYLMAKISISQSYYEDAIPLLETALEIAPKRSDLVESLGESYFKAGRIDRSIEEFQKLIELEPSVRAYSFLGISHTYSGRLDAAKRDFQSCRRLEANNNFCLFYLGYIAKLQGDLAGSESILARVLRSNPDYPDALLELANIRIESKRYPEAAELLRKYVRVRSTLPLGHYKLAMVEKNLHETSAAERDLATFQALSKDASIASHPYDHLFDYLDSRSSLAPDARVQEDVAQLAKQMELHPDQPEILYALAEAYLKSGKTDEARNTIKHLSELESSDPRALTEAGALLARYGFYDDSIELFKNVLNAKPEADDARFDLANAYFRKGRYSEALDAALLVSERGRKDEAYLALLGDIYAHLGDDARAAEIYRSAISRNPENDQDYLSLALLQFRENNFSEAKRTLLAAQARLPGSGKIYWGLGLAAALEGDTVGAGRQFERSVELLPEWPGSYSTLGVFYFETGQIAKAKEVLDRFKNSGSPGSLDVNRIEATLAQAPTATPAGDEPLSNAKRLQLLQFALYLADKTL
jgi:tetratricopeptide (TPR) repeat protein